MAAIVFENLAVDLGPSKLVVFRVDRKDLPHLTFSWNNPSGEVDVHLTPAFPRGQDDRESILRIQESELKNRFSDLLAQIWALVQPSPVQMVWCVQARWLASRGYFLVGPKHARLALWLKMGFPKKRGKYRLDAHAFRQLPPTGLYPPTTRRLAEMGQAGQAYAVCSKGPQRGRILLLQRLSWSSASSTWVAFDDADTASLIRTGKKLLPRWLAHLANGAWKRIYDALQLDEVGFSLRTSRQQPPR